MLEEEIENSLILLFFPLQGVLRGINAKVFEEIQQWVLECFNATRSPGEPSIAKATWSFPVLNKSTPGHHHFLFPNLRAPSSLTHNNNPSLSLHFLSKPPNSSLSASFYIFHGLFLTLLFTSSARLESGSCRQWWIPAVISEVTSVVFVVLVQAKLNGYWRERKGSRSVTRCVQELRMKGASFDLSKDSSEGGKKMKSSRVEIKWKPWSWCCRNVERERGCFFGVK